MSERVEIGDAVLLRGDALEILPTLPRADVVVTDPPYGETRHRWDRRVEGWHRLVRAPALWCFGSLRFFLGYRFDGWCFGQEIVWEKHNGTNPLNDRFRRVHELVVMFYRGRWTELHREVPTLDATRRTVRRKKRPAQWDVIGEHTFTSIDGGPRLQRSVIRARSCHGVGIHPTQKPLGVLRPIVSYSAPRGGLVVDPFMGSGATVVAALETGRRAIGIEADRECFEAACRWIEESRRQRPLFAQEPGA